MGELNSQGFVWRTGLISGAAGLLRKQLIVFCLCVVITCMYPQEVGTLQKLTSTHFVKVTEVCDLWTLLSLL